MKILYLTLKSKWYDMIASGEKTEEYREIKPFWIKRLVWVEGEKENFTHVKFARGGHFHPSIPQMTVVCNDIKIGQGVSEWGAEEGKEYFVIKLGEILKSDTLIK